MKSETIHYLYRLKYIYIILIVLGMSVPITAATSTITVDIVDTGGNHGHNNMLPFSGLNYITM